MEILTCAKESFTLIGKEGSTESPIGIPQLWKEVYGNFQEISHLVKKDEEGNPLGFWGAMSDFSRSFFPWEDNFSKGLYLAGAEVSEDSEAPEGWSKWVIPPYQYLYVKCTSPDTFSQMIAYLEKKQISLAGAVHEFYCPKEHGQTYLYFPVQKVQPDMASIVSD